MSTSASDHEMGERSNSPLSYNKSVTPLSSPSQQVPQIDTTLTGFIGTNENFYNCNDANPFLRIVVQPQEYFRFRYDTERSKSSGTHGCLKGTYPGISKKKKIHPAVELVNYSGKALIKCKLEYHNNDHHLKDAYKLLDNQNEDYSIVVEKGSYTVGFADIEIYIPKQDDLINLLYRSKQLKNKSFNEIELRDQCLKLAKNMNLNIVRLKFSAHDIVTKKEICDSVYSNPIKHNKNVTTSELKICRMSSCSGKSSGGDNVLCFVEKVNKNNIKINFFEEDANKRRVWSAMAKFLPSDVHYQYGIAFSTPAYRDPQTAVDVKVFIELVRPTDGHTSEPKEFTYIAEEAYKQMRRQANNNPFPIELPPSPNTSSANEISTTVVYNLVPAATYSTEQTASAVFDIFNEETPGPSYVLENHEASPMWCQTSLIQPQIDSATQNNVMLVEDNIQYTDFEREYMELFSLNTDDVNMQEEVNPFANIPSSLVADSGRAKVEPSTSKTEEQTKKKMGFFKPDDATEVKKLVKELCEKLREKDVSEVVRCKLELLFDIKLSDGGTFLHMTLIKNQPSFEALIKVIHSVKMPHLLNYANNNGETILHLASVGPPSVVPPSIVPLLIAKGCDPMLKNTESENAVHLAVRYNPACLGPLLDAVRAHGVLCSLDARNAEQQSALHLCALHNTAESAALLVARGADYGARDAAGRTPLHLCAYDARPLVARALLSAVRASDVDAVDGRGNTALQIVCGRALDDSSLEMAELLLAHGADPLRRGEHTPCAWELACDTLPLREVLRPHVPPELAVKPEPDEQANKSEPHDPDVYESADDNDDDFDNKSLETLVIKLKETGLTDSTDAEPLKT